MRVDTVSAGGHYSACWYATDAKAGATQITILNGNGYIVMTITELTGVRTYDQGGTASGSGTNISVTTLDTLDESNELVVAYACDWDHYAVWTPGSGYTMQQQASGNGTGFITAMASKHATGKAAQTATFSKTPSGIWTALVMTFKAGRNRPKLLQLATNSTMSGTSINVSLPNNVRAGSFLIACSRFDDGASYSDSLGNSWNTMQGVSSGSLHCFGVKNYSAGPLTLTVTGNSAGVLATTLMEVDGHPTTVEIETSAASNGTSVSITPSAFVKPAQFTVAMVGDYWPPMTRSTFTFNSGWTVVAQMDQSGGKYGAVVAVYDRNDQLTGIVPSLTATSDDSMNHMGALMISVY